MVVDWVAVVVVAWPPHVVAAAVVDYMGRVGGVCYERGLLQKEGRSAHSACYERAPQDGQVVAVADMNQRIDWMVETDTTVSADADSLHDEKEEGHERRGMAAADAGVALEIVEYVASGKDHLVSSLDRLRHVPV